MTLSDETGERPVDIARLQPARNKELQNRWDLKSRSEVRCCLESELRDYYYRDDNSLIHAMAGAAELVGVEPGVEDDDEAESAPSVIRVPSLEVHVFEVVVGPDERSESVISVLNELCDGFNIDPDVDDVRRALRNLHRRDVTGVVCRAISTFRLVVERDEVDVEVVQSPASAVVIRVTRTSTRSGTVGYRVSPPQRGRSHLRPSP